MVVAGRWELRNEADDVADEKQNSKTRPSSVVVAKSPSTNAKSALISPCRRARLIIQRAQCIMKTTFNKQVDRRPLARLVYFRPPI